MPRTVYVEVMERWWDENEDKLLGRFDLDEQDDPCTVGEKVYQIVRAHRRLVTEASNAEEEDLKVILLQWPLTIDRVPFEVMRHADVVITHNGIVAKHREGRHGGLASEQMLEDATLLTLSRVKKMGQEDGD